MGGPDLQGCEVDVRYAFHCTDLDPSGGDSLIKFSHTFHSIRHAINQMVRLKRGRDTLACFLAYGKHYSGFMESFTDSYRSNFRSFSLQHYSFLVWDINIVFSWILFLIQSPTTYLCISHTKKTPLMMQKQVYVTKKQGLPFANHSWCGYQLIVLRPKSYLPQYLPSFHMHHWETRFLLQANFTYQPYIIFYD